jgi:hypothetical protein
VPTVVKTFRTARNAVIAVGAALFAILPAAALADEARVRVQDGLVWARFDSTPGIDAINAIKRATAIDVVIPATSMRQTLTLRADAMPVELFVRRVLQSLDVGGFALVYNAGAAVEQVFVAAKGYDSPAQSSLPELNATSSRAEPARPSVPFLMRYTEAASMKLGSPGQVIVVQSRPFAATRTTECNGQPGDYPVQTVLVTDAGNTYITSIVVCTATGLSAGERLMPGPPTASNSGDHARFVGNR